MAYIHCVSIPVGEEEGSHVQDKGVELPVALPYILQDSVAALAVWLEQQQM